MSVRAVSTNCPGFAVFVLKEKLTWNYLVGFAFIFLAVFFIFKKW
jgi:uncharacterized protein